MHMQETVIPFDNRSLEELETLGDLFSYLVNKVEHSNPTPCNRRGRVEEEAMLAIKIREAIGHAFIGREHRHISECSEVELSELVRQVNTLLRHTIIRNTPYLFEVEQLTFANRVAGNPSDTSEMGVVAEALQKLLCLRNSQKSCEVAA